MFTVEDLRAIAAQPQTPEIAKEAKRLLDHLEFRGTVWVDLPKPGSVGDDDSWTNVHEATSVSEAIAWVKDNIGGCDEFGNLDLLTCGDRQVEGVNAG